MTDGTAFTLLIAEQSAQLSFVRAKEQKEIQRQLKSQLQKLAKLRADNAAQAAGKAASRMAKAEKCGGVENAPAKAAAAQHKKTP